MGGLVLHWRDDPDLAVEPAEVEPVDVPGDGDLEVVDVFSGSAVANQFGLEQRVERLAHGVDAPIDVQLRRSACVVGAGGLSALWGEVEVLEGDGFGAVRAVAAKSEGATEYAAVAAALLARLQAVAVGPLVDGVGTLWPRGWHRGLGLSGGVPQSVCFLAAGRLAVPLPAGGREGSGAGRAASRHWGRPAVVPRRLAYAAAGSSLRGCGGGSSR